MIFLTFFTIDDIRHNNTSPSVLASQSIGVTFKNELISELQPSTSGLLFPWMSLNSLDGLPDRTTWNQLEQQMFSTDLTQFSMMNDGQCGLNSIIPCNIPPSDTQELLAGLGQIERQAIINGSDLSDTDLTPHQIEESIRCSIKGVSYQKEYQRWKCTWHADERQHQKYFSAKKLGFRRAKQLAIEWKIKMEKEEAFRPGRRLPDPRRQSGVKGVAFNTANRWYASWYNAGKQRHLYFSVEEFGFETAKQLATIARWEAERSGTLPSREFVLSLYRLTAALLPPSVLPPLPSATSSAVYFLSSLTAALQQHSLPQLDTITDLSPIDLNSTTINQHVSQIHQPQLSTSSSSTLASSPSLTYQPTIPSKIEHPL